jgi:ATP-binding cassette subfamily B protein
VALLIRSFFDILTGDTQVSIGPWSICAVLVAISLSRTGFYFLMIAIHLTTRFACSALLRQNLFEHILNQPGAISLPESPGETVSRFRGDAELVGRFVWNMPFLVSSALFTVYAVIVMMRTNSRITLLVFVPLLAVVVLCRFFFRFIGRYADANREATGKVTGFIGEIFGGVEAVKVAHSEQRMVRRFEDLSNVRLSATIKDRLFNQLLSALWDNINSIATAGIFLLAAQYMKAGSFTVGDFSLFVFYLNFFVHIVFQFGGNLAFYKRISICIKRLLVLMKKAPQDRLVKPVPIYIRSDLPELPAYEKTEKDHLDHLAVRGLTYSHGTTNRGIRNIDLSLSRGSFTVVTGRIGSGKSTLLRVLLGLLPKESGDITWNEETVTDPSSFMILPRVAYTPQIAKLFDDTLRNNILLGLDADEKETNQAIRSAVLEKDVVELDKGLDTLVGTKGVKLSGGQQQRTAAARMFIRNPELLVFDDLSSALDVETEKVLWERIFQDEEACDTTFLVVSHRKEALKRADHIIVLKDGTIDGEGPLETLLVNNDEMRAIWEGNIELVGNT